MGCNEGKGNEIIGMIYYKETDLKVVNGKKVVKRKYKADRTAFIENKKGKFIIPLQNIFPD